MSPLSPIYRIVEPVPPSQNWIWSEHLMCSGIEISSGGKTVNKMAEQGTAAAMVDVALSEGKHSWKIRLDKMPTGFGYRIGVAQRNLSINSAVKFKNFCGFNPSSGYKQTKGSDPIDWGKKANEGEVIEI